MPNRKGRAKAGRGRRSRGRPNGGGGMVSTRTPVPSGTAIMRGPGSLLPSRLRIRMRWSFNYSSATFGAGSYALYQYRLNSIYDPDYTTGLGDLSYWGYTEISALYKFYRVLKTKWHAELQSLQNSRAYWMAAYPSNDASVAAGDPGLWPAWPFAKHAAIPSINGMNRVQMRQSLNLAKFTGARNFLTDDNYASQMGSNPSNVIYLNLGYIDTASGTGGSAGDFAWTMTFESDVELWEQADNLPTSLGPRRLTPSVPWDAKNLAGKAVRGPAPPPYVRIVQETSPIPREEDDAPMELVHWQHVEESRRLARAAEDRWLSQYKGRVKTVIKERADVVLNNRSPAPDPVPMTSKVLTVAASATSAGQSKDDASALALQLAGNNW